MEKSKKLTDYEIKRIHKECSEHNISQGELAKELDIPLSRIKVYLSNAKLRWYQAIEPDSEKNMMIKKLYIEEQLMYKEICQITGIPFNELRRRIVRMGIKKSKKPLKRLEGDDIINTQKLKDWTKEHYKIGQMISFKGTTGVIESIVNTQVVIRKKNYVECYSLPELYCVGAITL